LSKPSVWIREATGVVKNVNPLTMFWANMGEIGFGGGFLFLNIIFASAASSITGGSNPEELIPAVGIFTLAVLFEAFIFYHVTHTVGRTAGDYVWLSRTISPNFASFLMLGFVFTGIPFIAVDFWFLFLTMAPSFTVVGQLTSTSWVTSVANSLYFYSGSFSAPEAVAIAIVVIAAITAIDIVRPSFGFKLLAGLVAVGFLASIVMVVVFLGAGPSGVQSAINTYLNHYGTTLFPSVSNYTALATSPAFGGGVPSFTWMGVFLLFPFIAIYMPWINNVAAFGGELKSIRKSALYATFVAVGVSGVLLIVLSQMYISYVGGAAAAYGLAQPFQTMLSVATMVAGNNPALDWFMNLGFSLWFIASVCQTILVISRYLLGMSFDRFIPTWFAKVSDRFHSPVNGLIFPAVCASLVAIFVFYYSWISAFSTTALGTMYFACMGLTAVIYGYRKRAELKRTASALIVSGVVVFVFFIILTGEYFAYPYFGLSLGNLGPALAAGSGYMAQGLVNQPWGGLPWLVMILAFWVGGAFYYTIRRNYLKKKGVDLSVTYKEIPPE
jgi:amino acid transporter